MEEGGFYHDRHTATLSTDYIRNIGKHCRIRKQSPKAMRKRGMQTRYLSAGFGDFMGGIVLYVEVWIDAWTIWFWGGISRF